MRMNSFIQEMLLRNDKSEKSKEIKDNMAGRAILIQNKKEKYWPSIVLD